MEKKVSPLLYRVDMALKESPHLMGRLVTLETNQDTVILKGQVDTYYQKQMAQEILRKVEGVQRVDNQLEVSWC